MAQHTKVLVIGGGIGGFGNALALRRHGAEVELVEQAPEFGEVGAGLQMSPNATRLLREWGILDRAIETGVAPRYIVFRDAITGEELLREDVTGEYYERYGAPYIVAHRSDLHRLLWEECERLGVVLHNDVRIEKVANTADGARATAVDGRVFEADAVIAADGLKSVVRAQLSDDQPVGSEYVAYRGALPISQIKHAGDMEAVVVWMGPECHLVQYPLRQGELFNTVAVYRSKSFAAGQLLYEGDAELREAYQDCVPEVRAALDNLSHIQRWPMFDRVPIGNWVDGNIALAGDAAHPMLQYLAQGACQALEDAAALEAIAAKSVFADPEHHDATQWNAVFQEYNAVRQPRTARIQTTARMWGESWHLSRPVERTVRNILWKAADKHGAWDYADWLYGEQKYADPSVTEETASLATPRTR
ncbi:FAD-dependent monooxygenase [Kocuria sp. CPCC 205292]|uniref:FAD-dependent monooxygenase n=1 Tax=Kocuria cellulosilytica TaxID=3071451 RepID=UPI0034D4FEB5